MDESIGDLLEQWVLKYRGNSTVQLEGKTFDKIMGAVADSISIIQKMYDVFNCNVKRPRDVCALNELVIVKLSEWGFKSRNSDKIEDALKDLRGLIDKSDITENDIMSWREKWGSLNA